MSQDVCSNCGANDFVQKEGYKICKYCNSKFELASTGERHGESIISLQSDIDVLLQKCKNEPWNSRKYAGLILDIDPTNREALEYLR